MREYAIIEGRFPKHTWSLIIGRIKVPRSRTGRFRVKTQLNGKQKTLVMAAVGPDGEVETETIKLNYPGYIPNRRVSPHSFAVGVGLTTMSYHQDASEVKLSDAFDISQKAITVKGSYLYKLAPPHWDLGLSAFFTALPFGSDVPGASFRSLGLNIRIGYVIPGVKEPWRLMVMAGEYYTTMFASPADTFGFQNLSGPQLFPVFRRAIGRGDSLSGYFKFSPVSGGLYKVVSLRSREIAGGLTYSFGLKNRHSLPISLDISNLLSYVETTDEETGLTEQVQIKLTTVSLGVSYTF